MAAPRLGRTEQVTRGPEDFKFGLGDLLAGDDDLDNEAFEWLAREIGHNLTSANLKSYREVARAWPREKRIAASWTVHRTLKNADNRFELVQPGMKLREAQVATGKTPADTEHPSRWDFDRRVEFVIIQLQDTDTAKAVREKVDGRKHARAVRAASRAVEEELSAEYREALREFREARDAKSPERAVYDAIFKMRDAREYVRAVAKASMGEDSFIPDNRKTEVIAAVRDLALGSIEGLVALGANDPALVKDALDALGSYMQPFNRAKVSSDFNGTVIDAAAVLGAELA